MIQQSSVNDRNDPCQATGYVHTRCQLLEDGECRLRSSLLHLVPSKSPKCHNIMIMIMNGGLLGAAGRHGKVEND
jgi:hypothetical protein